MVEYLSAAETAKFVRGLLKKHFPGVKFSVRSKTYSMGSSVNVQWTDGPTTARVEAVVKGLSGSGFDGMIDLKYNRTHWLLPDGSIQLATSQGSTGSGGQDEPIYVPKPHPDAREVNFADHIMCNRLYSREFLEKAAGAIFKKFGKKPRVGDGHLCADNYDDQGRFWRIYTNSEIVDGKLVCYDPHIGDFMNK